MTGPAATPNRLLEQVLHAVRQIHPAHPCPQPADTFAELGLDSLDRLALIVALEQATGRPVDNHVFADATSPADLAHRLRRPTDRSSAMNSPAIDPDRTINPPSPTSGWLDDGAVAGGGTRLWHHAQISAGAIVGDDCTLGKGGFIGSGSTIGHRVKIGNYANVFGARIGDEAMICPGALLLEDPAPRATTPDGRRKGPGDWDARPVTVGAAATIGAGAMIAPGVTIGEHALVAIGAVVLRDVPAHALVIGNPAHQIGWACRCANTLDSQLKCPACSRTYHRQGDHLVEQPVSQ
jgi:acetyltransferase-like isoleucine patch superfamily enzyme